MAVTHRTDKNLATLLGRPPRLPHDYCDATPPLDLDDDHLFLEEPQLQAVLLKLDKEGWNIDSIVNRKFRPASVIRLRYMLSALREKVLQLSLGQRMKDFADHLA